MKKFDSWNRSKKKIHASYVNKYIHEREIWWCSLGINIGHEQDGKNILFERPVLILKKFNRDIFLGVPLTTKSKSNPYYYPLDKTQSVFAIVSQLRILSTKRLSRRSRTLNDNTFQDLKEYMSRNLFGK